MEKNKITLVPKIGTIFYDETIDNLCRNIYGKPRRVRPQLGEIPAYAKK